MAIICSISIAVGIFKNNSLIVEDDQSNVSSNFNNIEVDSPIWAVLKTEHTLARDN